MDDEVTSFEESILFFADAYRKHGPGSQTNSEASSESVTPALTPASSAPSSRSASRASSFVGTFGPLGSIRRPSFLSRLSGLLTMGALPEAETIDFEDPIMEENQREILAEQDQKLCKDQLAAWQIEAASVDRSVKILPGVKKMISSIPEGRYAVATSGAKTYGAFSHSISLLGTGTHNYLI